MCEVALSSWTRGRLWPGWREARERKEKEKEKRKTPEENTLAVVGCHERPLPSGWRPGRRQRQRQEASVRGPQTQGPVMSQGGLTKMCSLLRFCVGSQLL